MTGIANVVIAAARIPTPIRQPKPEMLAVSR
jgi:hypothetical protein